MSIMFVIAAGATFFTYTRPTYDTLQQTQIEIAQYDEALNKAAELRQVQQTLLSRYNSFNPADLDRLQKLIPDHVDNIALILDLNAIAKTYGMPLENVDVAIGDTVSAKSTVRVGVQDESAKKYDSITMKFTTRASYDTFLKFMTELESSLRLLDLQSLTVSSASSGAGVYGYQVTLKTYWLK
jgi:hypothetical protein